MIDVEIWLMDEAHTTYVKSMLVSFTGDAQAFHDFMLLDHEFHDMDQINADVIKCLEPCISIWTMGNNNVGDGLNAYDCFVLNMLSVLPPLMEAKSLE